MQNFKVQGNIVDIPNRNIFFGEIGVENGKIKAISAIHHSPLTTHPYILPGFIDSHVHVESSMLVPSEFGRLAVVHGTVSTISDPHEIANVCGLEGVEFMIENGNTVPFKFNFGAPSCVPATIFETAGATLDSDDVRKLLERPEIKYLSEMMNFPGVLFKDEEVMKKIAAAHEHGKPVDGHAPGLRGDAAQQYIDAASPNPAEGGEKKWQIGISTDHECFTEEEALDKLQRGMKILIREGSAAKNFEALIGLMNDWPDRMMFCSDDKHPDSLVAGHINQLCARAVAKGIDIFNVLKAACINPILHYKLDVGKLEIGDAADFIIAENLVDFNILQTYIDGELVAENGKSLIVGKKQSDQGWTAYPPNYIHPKRTDVVNNFNCSLKSARDFEVAFDGENEIPVIEALDGQLITNKLYFPPKVMDGKIVSDIENDVLKIVVINRYHEAPIAKAWIKNFGLKHGAIASSVAHDSHNIIAVGVDDENIAMAVNLLVQHHGGISAIRNCPVPKELQPRYKGLNMDEQKAFFEDYFTGGQSLPLPVAGLMSDIDGYKVAESYTAIDKIAKQLGADLTAPFMTLSFMALLVIPHLKLSDKGLFDGDGFKFI